MVAKMISIEVPNTTYLEYERTFFNKGFVIAVKFHVVLVRRHVRIKLVIPRIKKYPTIRTD